MIKSTFFVFLFAIVLLGSARADQAIPSVLQKLFPKKNVDVSSLGLNAFSAGCLDTNLVPDAVIELAEREDWREISEPSARALPWGILGASIRGWKIAATNDKVAIVLHAGGNITQTEMAVFARSRRAVTRPPLQADDSTQTQQPLGMIECSVHMVSNDPTEVLAHFQSKFGIAKPLGYREGIGKQVGLKWELFRFTSEEGGQFYFSYDSNDNVPFLPNVVVKISREIFPGESADF